MRDELSIDVDLVRGLVDRAFPEYVDDDVKQLRDSGSSNALFRRGNDKLVRLPRQPGGGASIDEEASWLLRGRPIDCRSAGGVGVGEPDLGYP